MLENKTVVTKQTNIAFHSRENNWGRFELEKGGKFL